MFICHLPSAQVVVFLTDLKPGEMVDEWYGLCPVNQTIKGEVGSIRLTVRYLHEVVMPLKVFTSLKEVKLLSKYGSFSKIISRQIYDSGLLS